MLLKHPTGSRLSLLSSSSSLFYSPRHCYSHYPQNGWRNKQALRRDERGVPRRTEIGDGEPTLAAVALLVNLKHRNLKCIFILAAMLSLYIRNMYINVAYEYINNHIIVKYEVRSELKAGIGLNYICIVSPGYDWQTV